MSMKNSDDTIGHQTHDLPTCSAVPQPTALLCAPVNMVISSNVTTFIDVCLHILEMCNSVCTCVHAECNGENTSRDLGDIGQEVV
jgi:hypothetical protein